MREFKDSEGRAWRLSLTVGSVDRIHAATGVDVCQPLDPSSTPEAPKPTLMGRLYDDLPLLGRVLAAMLGPQLEETGLSVLDFLDRLDGQVTAHASTAFFEELVDFYRRLGRTDLQAIQEVQQETLTLLLQEANAQMIQTSPHTLAKQYLDTRPGRTPESSASTPAN